MVWRQRDSLGIANVKFGAEISPDSTPAWDNTHLLYQQNEQNAFATTQQQLTVQRHRGEQLTVQRHRGGQLDWHSVDATTRVEQAVPESEAREAIPTAMNYPGAPNTRWWQIENAEVDLGGYSPDSAHTATALLTELIFSHSDDWFLFPVLAHAGQVVSLESIEVQDVFGRIYDSAETDGQEILRWQGLQPPDDWTLFKVDGTTPEENGLSLTCSFGT